MLERSGVRIAKARQVLTATLADPPIAGILAVPVGSPLIEVERVVRDETGTPVEFIRVLYRPDLYRIEISMDHDGNVEASGPKAFVS